MVASFSVGMIGDDESRIEELVEVETDGLDGCRIKFFSVSILSPTCTMYMICSGRYHDQEALIA